MINIKKQQRLADLYGKMAVKLINKNNYDQAFKMSKKRQSILAIIKLNK